MSPKKKPAPIPSAPKDELISALFDSESGGSASPKKPGKSGPPPPPPADANDPIYSFDADSSKDESSKTVSRSTATLSIVGSSPGTGAVPAGRALDLGIDELKEKAPAGRDAKLQKLEDVLQRLKPKTNSENPPKPKTPLYDSETAAAAMEAAKAPAAKVLESVSPPPVKPVGVVAKAIYSGTNSGAGDAPERAPTEPVSSKGVSESEPDEKTVTVPLKESPRPMWQDAKTEVISHVADSPEADPEAEQFMPTEIRHGSPGARFREEARQAQPGAAIFSSSEAALRQSENLRVAQKRISELEHELERVRRENESLRSAGETLRRRMDELQAHAENAETNTQEAKKIAEEERKVLRGQIQSRDREISEMKGRIDDAENRLESNFRKIRVRERDLEHRIEIIKAESQSITASKDRMILELKRQIDQISSELSHSKAQVQETFGQFKEKQETARRAVRALRIALTVLEGEEDSGSRKA